MVCEKSTPMSQSLWAGAILPIAAVLGILGPKIGRRPVVGQRHLGNAIVIDHAVALPARQQEPDTGFAFWQDAHLLLGRLSVIGGALLFDSARSCAASS